MDKIKIIRESLELVIAKSQFYSDCHEEELAKGLDKTLDPELKQFCYINKAANTALQALSELEQKVSNSTPLEQPTANEELIKEIEEEINIHDNELWEDVEDKNSAYMNAIAVLEKCKIALTKQT